MTNEEKADEISERRKDKHCVEYHCYRSAMKMAQWKDEQFAEEKQQWIEKACEWLFKNTRFTTNDIRDFKKEMKGV